MCRVDKGAICVADERKKNVHGPSGSVQSFGDTAVRLSRNPLGIISLFIVLIYAVAGLVTTASSLAVSERTPLIYFLIIFPVLVLALFGWIVVYRPGHLFAPQDFRNEENYVTLVASLTAASVRNASGITEQGMLDVRKITETARSLEPAIKTKSLSTRNAMLWVDDQPENNTFERQAFETLGLSFTLALSTEQALVLLKNKNFSAVISDMGRKEGPHEGYRLLKLLRSQGDQIPFFIYSGSNTAEQKREALNRGASGSTNDPQELIQMVSNIVLTTGGR